MSPFANCDVRIPVPSRGLSVSRNIQQRLLPPNEYNFCLNNEAGTWAQIQACGGLMAICPGKKYKDPPWIKMPGQGKRFSPMNSIALASITPGVDTLVTSFRVPLGYDGVINYIVQNYTGQGFQEGSGDLTWRIQLNQRYVKNYGNTEMQIGTLTQGGPTSPNSQIILLSNQLVQYFVNVSPTASLNGGRIICALFGFWWPR
jgi:hypothetical protein